MDWKAFQDELEKIAAPRWARKLLDLSPEGQKRVISTAKKLREVKPLGHGGERIADLVVHPKFGLSVRKIPLFQSKSQMHMDDILRMSAEQRRMEKRLRDIAGGRGPFAHILGEGPKGEAYYQFAPGKSHAAGKLREVEGLLKDYNRIGNQVDQVRESVRRAERAGRPNAGSLRDKLDDLRMNYRGVREKLDNARRDLMSPGKMPEGAEDIIRKLKLEFPGLHDIRDMNIVGGKIVDMSPSIGRVRMEAPFTRGPGFSKKTTFGGKAKARTEPAAETGPSAWDIKKKDRQKALRNAALLAMPALAAAGAAYGLHRRKKRKTQGL